MRRIKKRLFSPAIILVAIVLLASCATNQTKNTNNEKEMEVKNLDWAKNANIYEVNIRQYTDEGTIKAFQKHLPRLQEMGVDILWLMPVFPVGEVNRKGTLGSYYAVKDYKDINPEFGNIEDLKELVAEAHKLGMHVILDWVANHSSWDNVWLEEHPDFYETDDNGTLVSPFDWTDVISFDYNNPDMRNAMIEALQFWITETDIDGYRCDVAGMVPTDFWEDARVKMDSIKPVFMLAEDEDNAELLNSAFNMNYGWKLHHIMNDIAKGEKVSNDIWDYLNWNDSVYPAKAYRMYFTTNHDENSWNGTVEERMGDAGEVMAVLANTLPGMPLIYSGQEAGLNKRLEFFEKDTINWDDLSSTDFYHTLNNLNKNNKALFNGENGGKMIRIGGGVNPDIFAFTRENDGDAVIVVLNLSDKDQSFTISNEEVTGEFTNAFTDEKVVIDQPITVDLKPWKYIVLEK